MVGCSISLEGAQFRTFDLDISTLGSPDDTSLEVIDGGLRIVATGASTELMAHVVGEVTPYAIECDAMLNCFTVGPFDSDGTVSVDVSVTATVDLRMDGNDPVVSLREVEEVTLTNVTALFPDVYPTIRGEVELGPLLEALRARGATIALPRVVPESNELTLHVHEAGNPLEESGWGILEPREDAPRVDGLDVVLVPCLAIDLSGQRIGYGRGFYDRMLSEHPEALRVALAYDFQLLAEAPAFDHDVPVHVVVTDARVVRVGEDEEDRDPLDRPPGSDD